MFRASGGAELPTVQSRRSAECLGRVGALNCLDYRPVQSRRSAGCLGRVGALNCHGCRPVQSRRSAGCLGRVGALNCLRYSHVGLQSV